MNINDFGENYKPATSNWQTLSHNVVSSTPKRLAKIDITNFIDNEHPLHRYMLI